MTLLLVAKILSALFYALKKNTRTIETSSKEPSREKTVNQLSICLS